MNENKRLTFKQEEFAKTYAENGNGTQAALKVYETSDPVVAGIIAYENLKKPHIQARIEDLRQGIYESIGNALLRTGAIQKAIASAEKDLNSDDPKLWQMARKFLLECAKVVINGPIEKNETKHLHLSIPQRN